MCAVVDRCDAVFMIHTSSSSSRKRQENMGGNDEDETAVIELHCVSLEFSITTCFL